MICLYYSIPERGAILTNGNGDKILKDKRSDKKLAGETRLDLGAARRTLEKYINQGENQRLGISRGNPVRILRSVWWAPEWYIYYREINGKGRQSSEVFE